MGPSRLAWVSAMMQMHTQQAVLSTLLGELGYSPDISNDGPGQRSRMLPDADLMDEARALVSQLATGPRSGLALTRQAIRAASDYDLEAQLELEAELQGRAGRCPDYAEGVLAFLEKRPAQFTGSAEES